MSAATDTPPSRASTDRTWSLTDISRSAPSFGKLLKTLSSQKTAKTRLLATGYAIGLILLGIIFVVSVLFGAYSFMAFYFMPIVLSWPSLRHIVFLAMYRVDTDRVTTWHITWALVGPLICVALGGIVATVFMLILQGVSGYIVQKLDSTHAIPPSSATPDGQGVELEDLSHLAQANQPSHASQATRANQPTQANQSTQENQPTQESQSTQATRANSAPSGGESSRGESSRQSQSHDPTQNWRWTRNWLQENRSSNRMPVTHAQFVHTAGQQAQVKPDDEEEEDRQPLTSHAQPMGQESRSRAAARGSGSSDLVDNSSEY